MLSLLMLVQGAVPIPLGFFQTTAVTSSDSDVADWISRVQGQGSGVSVATASAVTTFVVGLKADSIWAKIGRLNIYAGNGLNALKAPLKNTCGNATDTLVSFIAGDYSENVGLTGNTTTKCITTGLLPSSCGGVTADNIHLSVYVRTGANTADGILGAQQDVAAASSVVIDVSYGGTSYLVMNNATTGLLSVTDSAGTGLYIGTRPNAAFERLYKDAVLIASNSGTAGTARPTNQLVIHAINVVGTNALFTARTLEMYSFGEGLTATDVTNYTARYSTLRTALGR